MDHDEDRIDECTLALRYFAKKTKTIPFPKLTPPAKKRWEQIPEKTRKDILENVWCSQCLTMVALQLREGQMSGSSLILQGTCKRCGNEAARLIEKDD
jgi:hypothetical protein